MTDKTILNELTPSPLVEVKNLHKSFGKLEVLKGVDLSIQKGDVVAIIGPSGCGKSTFLRSLNLLEKPESGSIIFEGTDIMDKSTNINQVHALCDNVSEEMAKLKMLTKQTEGYTSGNWVLMDYGDIIIHIFDKESRSYYDLERIWKDGKIVELNA